MRSNLVWIRLPQDVDVLDFQIPSFRPESPALNPSSLLTNQEAHGRKLRDDFKDGNEGFEDPGRQGRRGPAEGRIQIGEDFLLQLETLRLKLK